ncbi:hypothetical protein [Methanoculleus sp. MH98A]|uniref:hypothetical protein n=1 Tax=Methanoculleus sp. MH98A TaxID=1495314 RepID=UPI0004A058BB|nr:hypothetical protein [Methanoculleus sp. MH98A]KDE54352.1 hypothetical protein EI28_03410 [Methanoculleus sp. MH98A]
MGETLEHPSINPQREFAKRKIGQIIDNITTKGAPYWLFFYLGVPLFLLAIFYLVPQDMKDAIFIMHIPLTNLQSLLLHGYTHSGQNHILGNVAMYLVGITFVFAFEDNKKILTYASVLFFTLVILLSAGLSLVLFEMKGVSGITSQGFSAVVAAFYAYGLYSLIRYMFEELNLLNIPPIGMMNTPQKIVFGVLIALFGVALVVVIQSSLQWGQFIVSGTTFSNGIAHFAGFISGLLIPALISLKYRDRLGEYTLAYNVLVALSAAFGVVLYLKYLL